MTPCKTFSKIAGVPYDPLQNFLQNGHFVPYDPVVQYSLSKQTHRSTFWPFYNQNWWFGYVSFWKYYTTYSNSEDGVDDSLSDPCSWPTLSSGDSLCVAKSTFFRRRLILLALSFFLMKSFSWECLVKMIFIFRKIINCSWILEFGNFNNISAWIPSPLPSCNTDCERATDCQRATGFGPPENLHAGNLDCIY